MSRVTGEVECISGWTSQTLDVDALLARDRPLLLRGLASDWPFVQQGRASPRSAMDYLRSFDQGLPVQYSWGGPEVEGRPFYSADCTEINCQVRREPLAQVLDQIATHLDDARPPLIYVASLLVDRTLPGLSAVNDLGLAKRGIDAPPTIWIGNRVTASCHYDAPNNIACCVVGRRRFTLFPPDQIDHLYPGPLDPTPGGQAVSMVDIDAPDLARFPRYAQAVGHGQVAELEPGDAIYIPSLWWHHVQGQSPFTVLLNYWWSSVPAHIPTPMHALYHAIWTLRDRPEREKRAWREIFDYYVFGPADRAGEHLPEAARQVLGPIDERMARQLRAMLIAKLNR